MAAVYILDANIQLVPVSFAKITSPTSPSLRKVIIAGFVGGYLRKTRRQRQEELALRATISQRQKLREKRQLRQKKMLGEHAPHRDVVESTVGVPTSAVLA
jgi:hypothetical protein